MGCSWRPRRLRCIVHVVASFLSAISIIVSATGSLSPTKPSGSAPLVRLDAQRRSRCRSGRLPGTQTLLTAAISGHDRQWAVPRTPSSDVAERLLDIAYDLIAESSPADLSLREVQRRAGVSAATAYWHFENRAALLLAVSRRATARLADALGDAVASAESAHGAVAGICLAYLHFARDHQGLFQAIVANSSPDELEHPHPSARGRSGLAAFETLQQSLALLAAEGHRPSLPADAGLHVWAACHGLAAVLIDTPMTHLPDADKERLRGQHVAFVMVSLRSSAPLP